MQAIGRVHRPEVHPIEAVMGEPAPVAQRPVYWRDSGWIDCVIWRREDLSVGTVVAGPAIIEEYGSTIVVPASWRTRTDKYGNLILEKFS